MPNKFSLVYECRLCKSRFEQGRVNVTPEEAKKFVNQQLLFDRKDIGEQTVNAIHRCNDGSIGIAVLCGTKKML